MKKRILAFLLTATLSLTAANPVLWADELLSAPIESGETAAEPVNGAIDIHNTTVSGVKGYYRIERVSDASNKDFSLYINGVEAEKFSSTLSVNMNGKTLKEGIDYEFDSPGFRSTSVRSRKSS